MPPADNLLAFLAASVLLVLMPGPTVLFVVGRSIALGRRGGVLSVLGNALGMIPLLAAVALGLGAVIAGSVVLFTVVKLCGAAYLVYLGVQAIRHRHDTAARSVGARPASRSAVVLLSQGFVVGVTNPKTIAFFIAVLPQFVDRSAGAVPAQLALLGLIFVGTALVVDSAWAIAAGTARAWFGGSPKRIGRLGAAGGVMMIGLGGTLAVTGGKG